MKRIAVALSCLVAVLGIWAASSQLSAQTKEMHVNNNFDYFQTIAVSVFNGALVGADFAPYAEQKNGFSSDLRAVARLTQVDGKAIAVGALDSWMRIVFQTVRDDFPSLNLPENSPVGFASATIPNSNGQAFYFRFDDATGVLLIEDY